MPAMEAMRECPFCAHGELDVIAWRLSLLAVT